MCKIFHCHAGWVGWGWGRPWGQLGEACQETWGCSAAGHEGALGERSDLCSDCSWGSLLACHLELTWLLESQVVKVKCSRLLSTDHGYTDLQFEESPPEIPLKTT